MPDTREKLYALFQDCNNPSWKWFPNNAEMLKLIDYLVANGVTVQTADEQRNTYTVQEIEALQNEAYDLGADSVLHNRFGLSWDDAAGLRKEVARLQAATKWIPVTERMPELWTDILAFDSIHREIRYAYMTEDAWVGVRMNGKVTRWMPLPEPPSEVAK